MENERGPANQEDVTEAFAGQHLYVSRGGYTHHGLGDGKGGVIQRDWKTDQTNAGLIRRTTLGEFVLGAEIMIRQYAGPRFSPKEAILRAEQRMCETGYSLLGNNCEHFVEWCITGNHGSLQAGRGAGAGAVLTSQAAQKSVSALVASKGLVPGLSGSGMMSGLKEVGSVVGGGAKTGLALVVGAPNFATAALVNNTVLKDDPNVPTEERQARKFGRKASVAGATVVTGSSMVAVSTAGTVSGLGATGITSGLSAIGSKFGGKMSRGVTVLVVGGILLTAGIAIGTYIYKKHSQRKKALSN